MSAPPTPTEGSRWSREQILVFVLITATVLSLYLCYLIARPFLAPLAWALALAVAGYPLHRWIARHVPSAGAAAGLSVFALAILVVGPFALVGQQVVRQAAKVSQSFRPDAAEGYLSSFAAQHPFAAPLVRWIQQADLGAQLEGFAGALGGLMSGGIGFFVQLLLTFFILFFFFRDKLYALETLRSLMPVSHAETDRIFRRVADTIHATVFGTLVIALVQGALGGLMFWWLGIPAPLLWGVLMGLLAIIPVLGAFVVWIPAALILALQGAWVKAVILTIWGAVVIGLIDNLLYPFLVGKKLRFHTLPVFIAIVGGLSVFGAAGLILGPVILAVTDALLSIWRQRTAGGRTAETPAPVAPASS